MSLTVVNATVATAESGSSPTGVTVNVPSGTANGDLMVAFGMVTTSVGTVSAPSGWTSLDFQSASGPTMRTFWRKALSEPASYSVAMSANQNMVAAIVTLRGQDGTTPIDVHGALTRTALSATLTGATITTDTDGCMLIFLGGGGSNSAFTGPSSFTQQIVGSDSCSGLIATMLQTTAGATGAITATFNTGAPNNCAGLIAVKPGSPTSPTTIAVNLAGARISRKRLRPLIHPPL